MHDLRLEMRELIKSQQQDIGVSTVYVTHDQEEAMNLADRIVVMREGVISQEGEPDEVYDSPEDLFVALFMGSPGMNFIEGEVKAVRDGHRFSAGEFELSVAAGRPGRTTLGIRPEFVSSSAAGGVRGRVVMDEYLGDHRNVHVGTDFGTLVMRDDGDQRYAPGELLGLHFDADHIRLFDTRSGARLE